MTAPRLSTHGRRIQWTRRLALLFMVLLQFLAFGCGKSDMGAVSGVVTLDGKPLQDAFLEFIPTGPTGSTSNGRTNESGEYELMFTRDQAGAWLGPHRVRITTRDVKADENGREIWLPEKLPDRYHKKTELTCDVQAGNNRFDFDLKSDGSSPKP